MKWNVLELIENRYNMFFLSEKENIVFPFNHLVSILKICINVYVTMIRRTFQHYIIIELVGTYYNYIRN